MGEQVKAGLRALTVAPVDTIAQFGGTAVPFIAASVLTGGAATPAFGARCYHWCWTGQRHNI